MHPHILAQIHQAQESVERTKAAEEKLPDFTDAAIKFGTENTLNFTTSGNIIEASIASKTPREGPQIGKTEQSGGVVHGAVGSKPGPPSGGG